MIEPTNSQFYKILFDNITNKQYQGGPYNILQTLNSNDRKIKYTIEVNPDEIYDTTIVQKNGIVTSEVNGKNRKSSAHLTSRLPKRY